MRKLVMAVAAAALAMFSSGCSVAADDLPLPGTSVGGKTYKVTAEFEDALNLPIGAQVKLKGVPIGKVRTVTSRNFTAIVKMELRADRRLHDGATARLRTSTPLGELFVEMTDQPSGSALADGTTLKSSSTSTAPSIEDSLAATSLLLTGGNLTQLGTIIKETNAALDGRDGTARDLLSRLDTTMTTFAGSTDDISRLLQALSGVSATLDDRSKTINAALRDVAPAAKVLRDNTDKLSDLMAGITDLSTVTRRVINTTQADFLQILHDVGPVLDELLSYRKNLGPDLADLTTFAKLLDKGVPTDYLNVYLYIDGGLGLDLPGLDGVLGVAGGDSSDQPVPGLELPGLGGVPLPGLPGGSGGQPDLGLNGLLSALLGGGR